MEFLTEWRKSKENILVILILDKIATWLFKKRSITTGRLLATTLLFLLFEILQVIVIILARRPIEPIFGASLIISLISSLCFFSIASAHQYALELFEAIVEPTSFGKITEFRLINWLKISTNLRYQILASIICIIVILSYAFIFNVFSNSWDAVIFVPLMAIGGGQGFYWAFTTPLMTAILRESPVSDFANDPIYPSRSPILIALSKMLLRFATWIAFIVTLVIIFIFLVQPQFRNNGTVLVLIAVGVSYTSSAWTFVYSQINLSQITRNIKENTLFQIQSEINMIYQSLNKLKKSDFERLKSLMELHHTVSGRSNTLIDLSTFRIFLGSFLAPTLATLAGIIDWGSLFQGIILKFP